MREANDPIQPDLTPARRSFCLTDLSTTVLVAAALMLAAVLWLCIWAVL